MSVIRRLVHRSDEHGFPRMSPQRDARYTAWVKTLPSCVSGLPADDPHHPKGHGLGGTSKCSDYFVIPLTRAEHDEFHKVGCKAWEERHGSQLLYALRTLERAIREGVLVRGKAR